MPTALFDWDSIKTADVWKGAVAPVGPALRADLGFNSASPLHPKQSCSFGALVFSVNSTLARRSPNAARPEVGPYLESKSKDRLV